MPLAEWPPPHRLAWEAAVRPGDPFTGIGPAAHWRPDTQRKVLASYGRWLTYLSCHQRLDATGEPAEHLHPELLRGYVAELQRQLAPVTIAQRITDLHQALRVMAPGTDLEILNRASRVLAARARPTRNKRARYVPPSAICDLAVTLITEAGSEAFGNDVERALRYRDGLMLLILSTRAPRRRNFAAIEIGRHIQKVGRIYNLRFPGSETKNGRPWEAPLPEPLTPMIDHYIDQVRPRLLNGGVSDRLWITCRRKAMAEISIYLRVRDITRERLGVALNLHAFRDGPPTLLAIEDPEHVGAATAILGHADPRVTEQHYNLAHGLDARRRYQDEIRRQRTQAKGHRKGWHRSRKADRSPPQMETI
jgi:integrase